MYISAIFIDSIYKFWVLYGILSYVCSYVYACMRMFTTYAYLKCMGLWRCVSVGDTVPAGQCRGPGLVCDWLRAGRAERG